MVQSMTGFGKIQALFSAKSISIEIRAPNSKSLDLNIRLPSFYRELEPVVRKEISKKLSRGKIDFSIFIENDYDKNSTIINKTIVEDYINQLNEINKSDKIELLKIAIKLPDALKIIREEIDKEDKEKIYSLTIEVIDKVIEYRIQEGKSLEKDFIHRINKLEIFLKEIKLIDQERKEKIIIKLRQGLSQISQEIDENRFEQELIYYLEKYDITEEKVRLSSHLNYFKEIMEKEELNGKKLGFIAQELGREINTIGSKANHSELQKIVVKMKDDLEKIKEQLLNVL